MSLIVARRKGKQLCIVSDTKLTYPDKTDKSLKSNHSDGVIKTVIINSNVCLSFAGEVDEAEKAFRSIQKGSSIDDIIEILKQHHKSSDFKTEFLLCYDSLPEPVIYKFKNNEYGPVHSSWIGDHEAFNRFQEIMGGVVKKVTKQKPKENKSLPATSKPTVIYEYLQFGYELAIDPSFSKMSSAMDEVIEDTSIATVGGFKVNVIFKDAFYYNRYGKMYRGEFAMVGEGSHFIVHGEADEGAYTINFFGMSNDYNQVGLHIRQGNLGIVYDRKDNELLRPQLYRMDEVDFCDLITKRFNIYPAMTTQDPVKKYTDDGRRASKEKKFEIAKDLFDKALIHAKDKPRAEILFFKGVALLNLKETSTAMLTFQEAINIYPVIKEWINKVFMQASGKRNM